MKEKIESILNNICYILMALFSILKIIGVTTKSWKFILLPLLFLIIIEGIIDIFKNNN